MSKQIIYPLASSSWDEAEINAAIETIKSGFCTMSAKTKEFEKNFTEFFGSKYAIFCNSGSSANLLAVAALTLRKKNTLMPGDEVLVTPLSWSTTFFPLHQYGLKIRFVDIDLETLNIDVNKIESSITPETRAIFVVNLLGNPNEFDKISAICKKHNLLMLEDNCESMGAKFAGKFCGTFGEVGTFSSFFSHHICTIEGGIITTDDEEIAQIIRCIRSHGWTRELPLNNMVYNKSNDAWQELFNFVLPGYNLRPTDIHAAIGIQQLKKLPSLIEARRKNATIFKEFLDRFNQRAGEILITTQKECGTSSYFGFPMVLHGRLASQRNDIVSSLTQNSIESRPIVAGNFAKNPVSKYMKLSASQPLINTEHVDKCGFFLGNSHLDLCPAFESLFKLLPY